MAQGDFIRFHASIADVNNGVHNLGADDIRLGFISDVTTPAASTAGPHFGGTGTTNLATNQVTGGEVAAGGVALAGESSAQTAGEYLFDSDNIVIASNQDNPQTARWAVLYNNTDTNKRAIGFLDLGGVTDLRAGATLNIASGWFAAQRVAELP